MMSLSEKLQNVVDELEQFTKLQRQIVVVPKKLESTSMKQVRLDGLKITFSFCHTSRPFLRFVTHEK